MRSTSRNVVIVLVGMGVAGASLYALSQGLSDEPSVSDDDRIEITVEVPEEEEPEVEPTDEYVDAQATLEPIEPPLDAKLFARLHRNGSVKVSGINMTMQHRVDVFIPLKSDGSFEEEASGKGMSINSIPPYSLDVCNYDIIIHALGEVNFNECGLSLEINEVVLDGKCTHWDPNTTFEYDFIGPREYKEQVANFYITGMIGTATYKTERLELLGITEWNDKVEVWIIDHIPQCLPEGFPPDHVPTPIPWPTPTWQAN